MGIGSSTAGARARKDAKIPAMAFEGAPTPKPRRPRPKPRELSPRVRTIATMHNSVTCTTPTRILAFAAALAIVAAACGGSGESAAPEPSAAPAASPAPTTAPTVDRGPAVIPTTGVELPGEPATPEPTPQATPDATGTDATPTVEPAPVPTPDIEADAPDAVECDTAAGEQPYDSDGDGTADRCKNPDTGEEAAPVATPVPTPAPTPVPTPAPTPASTARPTPAQTPAPELTPAEALASAVADLPDILAEAERTGTWIVSLSDVGAFTWDADDGLRIVVLRIPVGDPGFRPLLDNAGVERDIEVADTAEARRWVQECMRSDTIVESTRQQTVAILTGAPDALDVAPERALLGYARNTLLIARSCLRGLGRFEQLQARYWWTADGLTCASRQSMRTALEGDRVKRALEVCPTIAHDPATVPAWPAFDPGWTSLYSDGPPAGMDWLMARCLEIVEAHANPGLPTDPAADYLSGETYPSCWDDKVAIVTNRAANRADEEASGAWLLGYQQAHACYHGFLGYVWARQTGRESRGPENLEIGCRYYAYRAVP